MLKSPDNLSNSTEMHVYCQWSNTQGAYGMLKNEEIIKTILLHMQHFLHSFIFGRKDGRRGNYIYNTDLSDSMFLLSNLVTSEN